MGGLSRGEKQFLRGAIAQDLRCDGRKRLSYRHMDVETGVIAHASGSARVTLGGTDVIASVKAEVGKPSSSQPDKGKISIFVDCSPTASPAFEGRGGEELSAELSASLQRCLLGGSSGAGAGIDSSLLCIVGGKTCWDLYIDGLVISSDGNLLDALGAAIKAALSNTDIPKTTVAAVGDGSADEPEIDFSDEEYLKFDTSGVPVIVTLTRGLRIYGPERNPDQTGPECVRVGKHCIVDATSEEESEMSSAISISINKKGRVCGLSKRGGAGLDQSVILDMISVATHVSEVFMNELDSKIAAAEAALEEE